MYLCSPRKPRIYIGRIPKGYAGTKKTVDYIAQLIVFDGVNSPFCVSRP